MPVIPNRLGLWPFVGLVAANLCAPSAVAQNDLTDIPDPDPVAELAAMRVDPLARVNLFAADPEISKPIQMNFDSTGGLWIASSEVYPQIKPGEKANDKIIVLRDTDGDGVSDQQTVFADGLLIPTGVIPNGPHAAYVAESTRLLYLEDSDKDGKADRRQVVLSGFGTEDTHQLVHTLRLGPDGCLYFNQSIYIHSHIDTPLGTRHLDGGGIWRFRPSTGQLEIFCKGFVNPWGHVFDHVGESFATDGAFFEGINYVFPDSVFVTSPGATRWLKGLNPGSPKHCGVEILSGTHIPPEWSGDFVANDFRSHRVCRFSLKPAGSGYISRQQPEIITTSHVAFRPIDARMGPDGALYVADWYNPIIQHGEVDFRDDRRDRGHGRIWRVSFPGRELDPWPDFNASSNTELLALLEDPALKVRQFTRQELWQRASKTPQEVLSAFRQWSDRDKSSRTLELLWFIEVLFNEVREETLIDDIGNDIDAAVESFDSIRGESRRTVLRSIWRSRTSFKPGSAQRRQIEQFILRQVSDDDPRVRLEAIVCAGQLDAAQPFDSIHAVLDATKQSVDYNLDFAIWQSIRKLDQSYVDGSVLTALDWDDHPFQLAHAVSAIGTPEAAEVALGMLESGKATADSTDALVRSVAVAGNASQLGRVVASLLETDPKNLSSSRFKPLLDRTFRDATIPQGGGVMLARIVSRTPLLLDDPDRISTLAKIARVWKVGELENVLAETLPTTTGPLREKVIAAIGAFNSVTARKTLTALASDDDVATRVAATRAIADSRPQAAVDLTIRLLQDDATGDAATGIIVGMISRKGMPKLLATAIRKHSLNTDRARSLLRRVQSAGGAAVLERAIRSAGNLESATWKLTPQLMQEILSLVKTDGSAARGEEIYRRQELQCTRCHAIGSAGGTVGPNLISTGGSSQPDYILESLLDSSAKLKEGYTTLSLLTDEAEVINGIVIGRSGDSIRLRLADGKEVQIRCDAIEQEKPGKSLMPDGLLDPLTKGELVDLVTFMAALGRAPEFTVSTEPLVRSLETLIYTDKANRRLNRTSTDTAAKNDPEMQWRLMTTKVDGTIALSELDQFKQHRQTPPTSFVRFKVNMPENGIATIELPTNGIDAWVDRKPTPISDLQSLKLAAGDHTVVIAIDRTEQEKPFKVRIGGDAVEANHHDHRRTSTQTIRPSAVRQ